MDEGAPGFGDAVARVFRIALPRVTITAPAPGIRVERDVPVPMGDGVRLRANVFRPDATGRFPVILSAHPYGKDELPRRTPLGYLPPKRYRFIRQPAPVTFSAYTTWEAPDPSYWVPRGYVVINLDLRGFGTSEGVGALLTHREASDVAEAIEWAAAQPWSTGKVGLNGVSYLAITQWSAAALRPPHLAAICPWEGFSDVYQDVAYPGGVREDGFMPFWGSMTEAAGRTQNPLREGQLAHPSWDSFWADRVPNLERIEVPALICGSFSDQGLHTRGAFEAFRRIGSQHRYLYTHRGGKWSTYYSPEALETQLRFFDCFLRGVQTGAADAAPVRLEVRSARDDVHSVRHESAWPLPGTRWTPLYLGPGALAERPLDSTAEEMFVAPAGGVQFSMVLQEDLELAGPMKLKLHVALEGATDAHLFVAVRKPDGSRHVPFEGPFGFGRDCVARGWLRIAHRRLDEAPQRALPAVSPVRPTRAPCRRGRSPPWRSSCCCQRRSFAAASACASMRRDNGRGDATRSSACSLEPTHRAQRPPSCCTSGGASTATCSCHARAERRLRVERYEIRTLPRNETTAKQNRHTRRNARSGFRAF